MVGGIGRGGTGDKRIFDDVVVVLPEEEGVEFVMGRGSDAPPTGMLLAEVVVEGGRFVVG